jgi:acetyltransferase-like isoleucine patch superfamily enzyme
MLIKLVEKIIKKRNPEFSFDEQVNLSDVVSIVTKKFFGILRSLKLLLKFKLPSLLFIERGVKFYGVRNMNWGKWVQIGEFTLLSSYGSSELSIGNNVTLGGLSRFIVTSSFADTGRHIRIGNNVGIGDYCHIGGGGGVMIGDDCIIGSYFSCHPSNHRYDDKSKKIKDQGLDKKGIKVGNNCWIGAKVSILDGVEIGDNCVIGAGSVVTKSFPDNSIIVGVPAKKIKSV